MFKRIFVAVGIAFFAVVLPVRQLQAGAEQEAAREKLSRVKVAVLYENITDGVGIGRSIEDTVKLLKETQTDLIFRGFWKWEPIVESPDDIPEELFKLAENKGLSHKQVGEKLRQTGRYYHALEQWVSAIKQEIPGIIFCGAVPAQQLCRVELNPITGKVYTGEETWEMALDPQKWNIESSGKPITKEELQERFSGRQSGKAGNGYDRRKATAYFPDITNPEFQQLLLSWAKKQIDCGADAIWIDMLYTQVKLFLQVTGNRLHPAIEESCAAITKIVDRIHEYGESKGKYIYVGTWGQSTSEFGIPYPSANLDFVTFSPSKEEILNKALDNGRWEGKINSVRQIYNDIPIFAFIDWSNNESPTVTFSQKLSKKEQREVLRTFDQACSKIGANFVYPLHGGYMGKASSKLSFGKKRVYDSLAPEFQTYETIKELAQLKARSGL